MLPGSSSPLLGSLFSLSGLLLGAGGAEQDVPWACQICRHRVQERKGSSVNTQLNLAGYRVNTVNVSYCAVCGSGTPALRCSNLSLAKALWVNLLWHFAMEKWWADPLCWSKLCFQVVFGRGSFASAARRRRRPAFRGRCVSSMVM